MTKRGRSNPMSTEGVGKGIHYRDTYSGTPYTSKKKKNAAGTEKENGPRRHYKRLVQLIWGRSELSLIVH